VNKLLSQGCDAQSSCKMMFDLDEQACIFITGSEAKLLIALLLSLLLGRHRCLVRKRFVQIRWDELLNWLSEYNRGYYQWLSVKVAKHTRGIRYSYIALRLASAREIFAPP
jgi:hypothetical protein